MTSLLKSNDEQVTTADESENLQFWKEVPSAWGMDAYTAPPYESVLFVRHEFATLALVLFMNSESITETKELTDDAKPEVAVFSGLAVVT